MSFTIEKTRELLAELEKKQGKDMCAKDYDALALHYHPDGVLIHKGVGAYYGRDAIKKALSAFLGEDCSDSGDTQTDPIKKLYESASFDGEYLIRRGTFKFGSNPKDFPFEQIYKKEGDEYLIYLDTFEYNP